MQPKTPKLLEDIPGAASYILSKTADKTQAQYMADDLLRPAVERHFEIIGEALRRLGKVDPDTLTEIPDHAQIIAFRNVLVHGYDAIDNRRVWDAIKHSLPDLCALVERMLRDV